MPNTPLTKRDLEIHEKQTRRDLEAHERRIKEHLSVVVAPVSGSITEMKATLYGREGRNGIVGDVADLKASRRAFKWVVGLFGSGGALAGLANFFKH